MQRTSHRSLQSSCSDPQPSQAKPSHAKPSQARQRDCMMLHSPRRWLGTSSEALLQVQACSMPLTLHLLLVPLISRCQQPRACYNCDAAQDDASAPLPSTAAAPLWRVLEFCSANGHCCKSISRYRSSRRPASQSCRSLLLACCQQLCTATLFNLPHNWLGTNGGSQWRVLETVQHRR